MTTLDRIEIERLIERLTWGNCDHPIIYKEAATALRELLEHDRVYQASSERDAEVIKELQSDVNAMLPVVGAALNLVKVRGRYNTVLSYRELEEAVRTYKEGA